ncbi:hypothetical protein DESPIGER_1883 [Desulfovibrio piger]|uniref:Uncharacterized protein n=1 Tax=Desulfovibrio piger TaxID=901 RepID=A0A1K1LGA0_9BACT|nr:hypothetical protein DESPIGER_1883 [Desulfovibrio piger]
MGRPERPARGVLGAVRIWREGGPLISAVDARNAPSSLTGTALWAAIRPLLTRGGAQKPPSL